MADVPINDLPSASNVQAADLLVLWQQSSNSAHNISGQSFTNWLVGYADGHGGIQSIAKTSSTGTNPVIDTYTITLADATTSTFTVTNGLKGATGAQTYVWIKWAAQQPTSDNQLSNTPDAWIGIYTGTASTAPTAYTAYTWYQYKGERGNTGYAVDDVVWHSNSGGGSAGTPGTTDTYYMYLNDPASTFVGSFEVYNGLNGSGSVSSVNGNTPDGSGNVTLTAADVGAMPSSYTAPVSSVNGLTGTVTINKVGSVALSTGWSGSASPYTQTVTVSGATVTSKSKVDLQPDSAAIEQMIADGCLALYIVNNNGTLTAYAVGAAPTVSLTIQASVTEVA